MGVTTLTHHQYQIRASLDLVNCNILQPINLVGLSYSVLHYRGILMYSCVASQLCLVSKMLGNPNIRLATHLEAPKTQGVALLLIESATFNAVLVLDLISRYVIVLPQSWPYLIWRNYSSGRSRP